MAQYLSRVRIAAIRLFGPHLGLQKGFLKRITPAMVKRAFRDKARRYHPDLHRQATPEILQHMQDRFMKMTESYKILREFLTLNGGAAGRAFPGVVAADDRGRARRR